jgi:hypothetical protein
LPSHTVDGELLAQADSASGFQQFALLLPLVVDVLGEDGEHRLALPGAVGHAFLDASAPDVKPAQICVADRAGSRPLSPTLRLGYCPGVNVRVEGPHHHDRGVHMLAGFAIRTDCEPFPPVGDGLLVQPETSLVGADLFDHLPEQLHQVVYQRLERGVVDLRPAAGDVVDKQIADIRVADLMAIDEVVNAALAADNGRGECKSNGPVSHSALSHIRW